MWFVYTCEIMYDMNATLSVCAAPSNCDWRITCCKPGPGAQTVREDVHLVRWFM